LWRLEKARIFRIQLHPACFPGFSRALELFDPPSAIIALTAILVILYLTQPRFSGATVAVASDQRLLLLVRVA